MDLKGILTLATLAGLAGLVVLHPDGAAKALATAGGVLNSYVFTVQGR